MQGVDSRLQERLQTNQSFSGPRVEDSFTEPSKQNKANGGGRASRVG